MRWADVYVCMLADGVALRNRCPQGQARRRVGRDDGSGRPAPSARQVDAMGRRLRLRPGPAVSGLGEQDAQPGKTAPDEHERTCDLERAKLTPALACAWRDDDRLYVE